MRRLPMRHALTPFSSSFSHVAGSFVLALGGLLASADAGFAQELTIKREPMTLINPSRYQIPLTLEPTQFIEVCAPVDGTVQIINIQAGEVVPSQTELLRLDATRQNYVLNKTKAALKAAQVRLELASSGGDAQAKSLAAAELEVAKAELEVANFDLQKTLIRTPIDGTVFQVLVQPGQFVKAGDPLIALGNTQKLRVEIPVDRNTTQVGATMEIAVEATRVGGTVKNVLPLISEQAPLRDLVESAATAELIIENPEGKFSPGQTVYSPLVPRHPVVEVANVVLSNAEGGRKIQVLRESVVTDVPVNVLGPVGPNRSFVPGAVSPADVLIVSSSVPLTGGMVVKPAGQPAPPAPVTNNFD